MPPVSSVGHRYVGQNQFEASFPGHDTGVKPTHSPSRASISSEATSPIATEDRGLGISPRSYGTPPSDRDVRMHTRTNFGKTRAYMPPVVPSSPNRAPAFPSPRRASNPFVVDMEEDAPDDEASARQQFTVRSLRPKSQLNMMMDDTKSSSQYHSDGDRPRGRARVRGTEPDGAVMPTATSASPRHYSDGDRRRARRLRRQAESEAHVVTAAMPSSRPDAYISETDESSMMEHNDIPFQPRFREGETSQELYAVPFSGDGAEARNYEDVKSSPARSHGHEARFPSPEDAKTSPVGSLRKEPHHSAFDQAPSSPARSPNASRAAPSNDYAQRSPARSEGDLTPSRLGHSRHTEMVTSNRRALSEQRRRRRSANSRISHPSDSSAVTSTDATSAAPSSTTDNTSTPDLDRWEKDDEDYMESAGENMESGASEMEYHSDGMRVPDISYQEFGGEKSGTDDNRSTDIPYKPISILKSKNSGNVTSDDSLFDFDGRRKTRGTIRKTALKNGSSKRGRRPRRRTQEPDDEESLDQDYGEIRKRSSSLQERTQQAWSFRNQRSYSLAPDGPKRDGVQFGNTDTVHHFEDDDQTQATAQTSRSMNSMYTKSPESEAEDVIKDLLFIGSGVASNPGRRKIKYQPAYKRDLKKQAKDDNTVDDTTLGTTDDVTLNTLDDPTAGPAFAGRNPYTDEADDVSLETYPRKSDTHSKVGTPVNAKENKTGDGEEDPLAVVWGYVEGGLSAVGNVLGLTPSPEKPPEEPEKNAVKKEAPVDNDILVDSSPERKEKTLKEKLSASSSMRELDHAGESRDGEGPNPADIPGGKDANGSFYEVMDYLLGDSSDGKVKGKELNGSAMCPPLEDDPRLADLTLHAVRAKHQLHDIVFDEKVTIDIEKDIKFSVVKTALPLGILFHENDGGCWISQVFPDGNAAKGGGVEVGDQLAAINGISAIELRVDQICTLITEAEDPDDIELTFLRYIGQLHSEPGNEVYQEKFEVTDAETMRKTRRKTPSPIHLLSRNRKTSEQATPKRESQKKKETSPQQDKGKRFRWFGRGKKNKADASG